MLKKMLWEMGTCSRLPERLIEDGRDSAKRVVSDTYTPNSHRRTAVTCTNEPSEDKGIRFPDISFPSTIKDLIPWVEPLGFLISIS